MRGEPVCCHDVAVALPRMLDGVRRCDRRLVRHTTTCLRCQAELAQYRRIQRLLHQLRLTPSPVSPGTYRTVVADLQRQIGSEAVSEPPVGRRRVVAAAAAAGAVAVVGATVLTATVWARGPAHGTPAVRSSAALLT